MATWVSPSLKNGGKFQVTTPEEILNQQFQSAFSPAVEFTDEEFAERCSPEESEVPLCLDNNFTVEGVCNQLQKLDPHKAFGPDEISPRILKEVANEIAPALTLLYQPS